MSFGHKPQLKSIFSFRSKSFGFSLTNYVHNQDLSFAKNNTVSWCFGKSLSVLDPPGPKTGLMAFSGSGNMWLRYLIQKSTGYVTGCEHAFQNKIVMNNGIVKKNIFYKISVDNFMRTNEFYNIGYPGELLSDGSAIIVLTHLLESSK